MSGFVNVSQLLTNQVLLRPDKIAIIAKKTSLFRFLLFKSAQYESLTFKETELRANHYAHTFLNNGLKSGDRILVFVKPCLDFPVIIFSLFKANIIPVFIDPGMGIDSMLKCIKSSGAKGLIGISKIHHLRLLMPSAFEDIKVSFVINGRALNAQNFEQLVKKNPSTHAYCQFLDKKSLAAILYTSGGTGIPKGVLYTHEMFMEQVFKLKQMFRLTPSDIDYPCFPLFGLFSLALGLTVVMPEQDVTKPSEIRGGAVIKSLQYHKVSFSTGSPALWQKVAQEGVRKKIVISHLKSVVTFGAPVELKLHENFQKIIPCGDFYTPYGATECLPVCSITSREILGETKYETLKGEGTCVGYPSPNVIYKILNLENSKVFTEKCAIGEILVSSSTMTPGYDHVETFDQIHRYIDEVTGMHFHRMGDMGKIDSYGRLWFLGRKVHCKLIDNEYLCTEEIEQPINYLPEIKRSALVWVFEKPILLIERFDSLVDLPEPKKTHFFSKIQQVLNTLPKGHHVKEIKLSTNFPVDTRHNIKIDRIKLANDLSHSGLTLA